MDVAAAILSAADTARHYLRRGRVRVTISLGDGTILYEGGKE